MNDIFTYLSMELSKIKQVIFLSRYMDQFFPTAFVKLQIYILNLLLKDSEKKFFLSFTKNKEKRIKKMIS